MMQRFPALEARARRAGGGRQRALLCSMPPMKSPSGVSCKARSVSSISPKTLKKPWKKCRIRLLKPSTACLSAMQAGAAPLGFQVAEKPNLLTRTDTWNLFYICFHTLWSFFIVLSVIVFIHEFGHYIVAKLCGVKIEAFSIGFGKEIIGRNDRSGTRWKLSVLPLGGYVKMFGDASGGQHRRCRSAGKNERGRTHAHLPSQAAGEKSRHCRRRAGGEFHTDHRDFHLFHHDQRACLRPTRWWARSCRIRRRQPPGLKPGDRILKINGDEVSSFNDIPYLISTNLGTPVTLYVDARRKCRSPSP